MDRGFGLLRRDRPVVPLPLRLHDDAHPGVLLLDDLSELGVRQHVDDRVVGARGLSQKALKFGEKRGDARSISPGSHHAEDSERSPGQDPQGDVHDGHLSDADFGRNLVLLLTAAQRRHVHFLGLLTHLIFMLEDSLNNEVVAARDDQDRNEVEEAAAGQDVGLVVHGAGKTVEGATMNERKVNGIKYFD